MQQNFLELIDTSDSIRVEEYYSLSNRTVEGSCELLVDLSLDLPQETNDQSLFESDIAQGNSFLSSITLNLMRSSLSELPLNILEEFDSREGLSSKDDSFFGERFEASNLYTDNTKINLAEKYTGKFSPIERKKASQQEQKIQKNKRRGEQTKGQAQKALNSKFKKSNTLKKGYASNLKKDFKSDMKNEGNQLLLPCCNNCKEQIGKIKTM